ncbi:MAG TPA: hypothetical protein VFW83_06725 [Bryobacteraceae bacterium]|nr:hypothetical protein [Bryobacteraceae bacterium]
MPKTELYTAIERFLESCRQPVAMDPGEDPIPIGPDNFRLESCGSMVAIEVWSETRNLVRRIRGIHSGQRSRLELEVQRFGGRSGRLILADLAHPSSRDVSRRGARLKYRERFRHSLQRQFPDWRLAELSTEPDLQHTLSPSYPRALLRKGGTGLAAIGASQDSLDPDGVLTFGLIWLDYLRSRESRLAIRGLAVFLPAGKEQTTCHRARYLNPRAVECAIFAHSGGGSEELVNPGDYTNFDTRLDPCFQPLAAARAELAAWVERLASLEYVERREHPDGSVSLAVRGLEFARASQSNLMFGIDHKISAAGANLPEIEELARGLARLRDPEAKAGASPLYTRYPEAWLESQVRRNIQILDPALLPRPLYGQVPQFAGGERGILDTLAASSDGRLAVVEVKASQDVHLPLQALDYWMRVKWHLERNEFSRSGYFPGLGLRPDPPKLLLIAPALEFHPSNETVLRYFSREVQFERLGVGLEWRRELRVMFRRSSLTCPSPFSNRSERLSPT